MISSSQGGDLETRFGHLLQPIRDLTKNWDVDIASHLEEYLEEIENVQVTFDGGMTTMNFAEAALLIQGTTCVYSKKVEYLYALVYQVLDLLTSKKKLQQAGSVDGEGNDKDAQFNDKQQDDEFLDLDDIREHTNIDMKGDGYGEDHSVLTVPRTPMSLVQFNEKEQGDNPLLSRTGEVLGSRSDFKLCTCTVHSDGTMLLDSSQLTIMLDTVFKTPTATTFSANTVLTTSDEVTVIQAEESPVNDDDTLIDEGNQNMSMEGSDGGVDAMAGMAAPANIVNAEEPELRKSERQKHIPVKPVIDPWEMLDPHQPDVVPEKPFKKGRTVRLPASLETATKKRKRSKAVIEKPKNMESLSEFCSKAYYSHASKFPSNPLKVPSFPEFEHLFWIEYKRRQALQRMERKVLADQGRYEELAEREDDNYDDNAPALRDVDDDNNVDFGLPADDNPLAGLGDPAPDDVMDRVWPLASESNSEEPGLVVSSYEELVRHHVEGFLAGSQQYAQITELSKRISEWEEKIVPTLSEEDTREAFDIHTYGTIVLDSFKERNERLPFSNIAQKKTGYDVCRLFLATLQLANAYNVEISSEESSQNCLDNIELKLLSKKRHYEDLQEYRAPSITS